MDGFDFRRAGLAGTHRLPACAQIGLPVDGRGEEFVEGRGYFT